MRPQVKEYNMDALSETLVKIIENDEFARKGRVEVAIFGNIIDEYDETLKGMMIKSRSIVFEVALFMRREMADKDFLIIFFNNQNTVSLVSKTFKATFPKRSMRIIVSYITHRFKMINQDSDYCYDVLALTASANYFNVVCLLLYNEFYYFLEWKLPNTLAALPQKPFEFPTNKFGIKREKVMEVIQYDALPYTYVKNGKVFGLEGAVIDEFCKKFGLDYFIVNNETQTMNLMYMVQAFHGTFVDITFNYDFSYDAKQADFVNLYEFDGLCFLVPRNILVSSFETFQYPFDWITTILIICSIILTIAVLKVFSTHLKSGTSLGDVILEVYKCTLGLGVSTFETMRGHEKIVILSFTVLPMIFITL